MNTTITISDSLIGSLCREIEQIRLRSRNINYSIMNCKDKLLKKRLLEEISLLRQRRNELKDISNEIVNLSKSSISKLLFSELCKRAI